MLIQAVVGVGHQLGAKACFYAELKPGEGGYLLVKGRSSRGAGYG